MAPHTHSGYRFEESPGLQHGCGICSTPLNHPRAKKTCYGKHAEPCSRFHHTMFRIGRGRSCDACKMSNEQHYKRHSTIATLLEEIYSKSNIETPVASLEQIAMAIHGYSEALIQEDRVFLDRALAKDVDLRERISKDSDKISKGDIKNTEIRQIMSRLGVDNIDATESKEQRTKMLRLADAIVNDIETVANESRETLKRQLGFYHYADKRAYNAMIRNHNVPDLDRDLDDIFGGLQIRETPTTGSLEDKTEQEPRSTTTDLSPGPKSEDKETPKPQKNHSPVKPENLKFIFVPNTPRTPKSARSVRSTESLVFPKTEPLKEKNVWNVGSPRSPLV